MRVRRAHLHDIFRYGDECVAMAGTNVVRLSALATFLVDQLDEWQTSEQLATAIVREFGEPPDGDAAGFVADTVSQLAALEIVRIEP